MSGDGLISSPYWDNNGPDIGLIEEPEYPDQCFWFIEARHQGETLLLKALEINLIHSPIVVREKFSTDKLFLFFFIMFILLEIFYNVKEYDNIKI